MDKQLIHFKHPLLGDDPLQFQNPVKFITANTLADVKEAIEKIESYTKRGYYAVGYVSYEALGAFYPERKLSAKPNIPYVYFGIYENKETVQMKEYTSTKPLDFTPNTSRMRYNEAIKYIHESIDQGLVEQVNYTIRLTTREEKLDTDALYFQLTESQQANFTAHLRFDDFEILSISPELFFAWDQYEIETRPMKGTMKRGKFYEEDLLNKDKLKQSIKDMNENEMIVDLVKDELKGITKEGTVEVTNCFHIETYPTVYQMTSTVKGETVENTSLLSIFESLFPAASIAGTPKLKAIELVDILEDAPRDVYCGAVGIVTPEGHAIFNVPIRTVLLNKNNGELTYGVGGGITTRSSAGAEYDEALTKSAVLNYKLPRFELLETMKIEDGKIFLLEEHLNRIKQSSYYFNWPFPEKQIRKKLSDLAKKYHQGTYKVRLLLNKNGAITYHIEQLDSRKQVGKVALAAHPINKASIFHYHKTTYRTIYNDLKIASYYDTLLWNEEGYITEFINGNLIYQLDQQYYTPPIHDGLLPGTYRNYLIENGKVIERSLHKKDLIKIEKMWFINSVRGWVKVAIKF